MRLIFSIVLAGLLLFPAFSGARFDSPQLTPSVNPRLQQGLEGCLLSLDLEGAVRQGELSVALVDITDPDHPRTAMVNGERMMYAASLPKIAILLGAFDRIEKGQLDLTEDVREKLTRMIRNSSNTCATEMLNLVGKPYLAELLQSPRYRLYDPALGGGLWVGKDYGKAQAWKRDPLGNFSHGATAFQVARFFYLLETGALVSPEKSLMMKEILGNPAIHHKFVKGLEKARPDARIYRKSGTWENFHADGAIVEHDGYKYIAVAIAKNPKGGEWLSELIVSLDDLVAQAASPSVRGERIQ